MESSDRWMAALTAALTMLAFQTAKAADVERSDPAPMQMTRHEPANSPLTLRVEAPTGRAAQLTYRPGQGWSSAAPIPSAAGPAEAQVTPPAVEQGDPNPGGSQPLGVFIDGPTGYTYVWNRGKGWTFVGRVIDRIE